MLRTLLKIGLLLVVGILVYNYFLGTPNERATSQKIFDEVKDVGSATWDLLKSEKEKFEAGKYDRALEKLGHVYERVRDGVQDLGAEASDKLQDLEDRREELQRDLQEAERQGSEISEAEKDRLQRTWKDLMQETEDLMKEIEE